MSEDVMAEQKKLSNELDEKIQGLAGDIYLQIEEKVADFILNNPQMQPVTKAQVEKHTLYQNLCQQQAELHN